MLALFFLGVLGKSVLFSSKATLELNMSIDRLSIVRFYRSNFLPMEVAVPNSYSSTSVPSAWSGSKTCELHEKRAQMVVGWGMFRVYTLGMKYAPQLCWVL